jgi:hypothetical protein
LDVVTEIYKRERFQFSSEKIAKWEAAAGVKSGAKQTAKSSASSYHVSKDISAAALQELPSPVRKTVRMAGRVSSSEEDVSKPDDEKQKMPSRSESTSSDGGLVNVPQEDVQVVTINNVAVAEFSTCASSTIISDGNADATQSLVLDTDSKSADEVDHSHNVNEPELIVEKVQSSESESVKESSLPSQTAGQERKAMTVDTRKMCLSPATFASPSSAAERILSPRSMLDVFVMRIKEAVRSDNPSRELGIILADAKKHHIPINPLVDLYTKERMALPQVPKDIAVPRTKADDNDLTRANTEESDVTDVIAGSDSYNERGLSETQLLQLQQLVTNSGEFETGDDPHYGDDIDGIVDQHLEDIDAFFSRFDIDGVHAQDCKKTVEGQSDINELPAVPSDVQRKRTTVQFQPKPNQQVIDYDFADVEPQDSSHYSERGNIAEVTTLQNGKETVVYMQETSLEVEFVEPILPPPSSAKKKKKVKEKKKKVVKLRPQDNRRVVVLRDDLPGYLGYWRSPWEKNRTRSHYYSGNGKKDVIDGVAAAVAFACRGGNARQKHFFLSEKERTKGHRGYRDIDFYSLYEATTVQAEDQDIDLASWDCRDVRQRFLHEKSVESRNWFGK